VRGEDRWALTPPLTQSQRWKEEAVMDDGGQTGEESCVMGVAGETGG